MLHTLLQTERYAVLDYLLDADLFDRAVAELDDAPWSSGVITHPDGSTHLEDWRRCSEINEAQFPSNCRLLLAELRSRLSSLLAIPVTHADGALIIRYEPGDRFDGHHDTGLYPENERLYTVIYTLCKPDLGGDTRFINLKIQIAPQPNRALVWRNLDQAGNATPDMFHAGLPVEEGTKIILATWFRLHPL